jgi:probable rRNA maturation factor
MIKQGAKTKTVHLASNRPGSAAQESLSVQITNRQRLVKVDCKHYQNLVSRVAQGVCSDLLAEPSCQTKVGLAEAISQGASVSLAFVSNRRIRLLNDEWRGKNSPTDVLSFQLMVDPPAGDLPWELGEIFISVEQALSQAKAFGHSLEREIAFLTAHGLLHLLGFDHEEPADEQEMFGRQEKILIAAGYPR